MNKKIKVIITSSFLIGTAFSLSSCVALSDFILGVQDYDRYCAMKENTNLPGFIDFLSKNSNNIYLTYRPPLSERDKKFIDKNNEISAILSSITNYQETNKSGTNTNYSIYSNTNDYITFSLFLYANSNIISLYQSYDVWLEPTIDRRINYLLQESDYNKITSFIDSKII